MALIQYLGNKPSKTDHLYGTEITWDGPGDVQSVSDRDAVKLLRHPDVWGPVSTDAPTKQPAQAPEGDGKAD